MLASSFSSVLFPDPLRPTMPKNSPRSTSKLIPSSASRSRSPGSERVHEPLLQRVDPLVGIRYVFSSPATSITTGPASARGAMGAVGAIGPLG